MRKKAIARVAIKISLLRKYSTLSLFLVSIRGFLLSLLIIFTTSAIAEVKSQLHHSIKPHKTVVDHLDFLNKILSNPDHFKETINQGSTDNRTINDIMYHAAEEAIYIIFKGRVGAHADTIWGLVPLALMTENTVYRLLVETLTKAYDVLKQHKIENIVDLLDLLFPHHEQLYYRSGPDSGTILAPYLDEHPRDADKYSKHIATLVAIILLHEQRNNLVKLSDNLVLIKNSEFNDIAEALEAENKLLLNKVKDTLDNYSISAYH